ncbi:bifunctional 3'-5' exonuclease/DNA polymerase [uncultured Microbacterium sp.]|uniref:bifunctional 3'-5' exonuclease/DNA polymerase n=1 Tax=uncultured Microbacterium sp. TaxID=191216 RepID=UPI0025F80BFD|nr:bifunctional 3'-5' exonuclease/DNA polymerase [uncultured Microbacterium sp.]
MASDTVVVARAASGSLVLVELDADANPLRSTEVDDLVAAVRAREHAGDVRWVWPDTTTAYPPLLSAGVRVARAWDLRLVHAILRDAAAVADGAGLRRATAWDAASTAPDTGDALFDLGESASGVPESADEAVAEYRRQHGAIAAAATPGALRLLAAAESAGALIAVELHAAGVPWSVEAHERLLETELGPRRGGGLPERIEQTAAVVRDALGDPKVSLDSQPRLLRSLHRAGLLVQSTSRWELSEHDHPAVAPLIAYKKQMRLYTANGWAWLAEWVRDGRFRPVYVPAGVVTGRWASSGGGALQIPRALRTAVRADPGWTLVTADVAQLEPRVLAAMARDTALAEAAAGRDLYAGIVERGAVASRAEAKLAMLGAMYGATTGESGRLLPRLRRTFPRAMQLVDDAARTGEEGGVVHTWLGRTSPTAGESWRALQSRASDAAASGIDETRARRSARDRGRFTRNFVVQGTAAEWALAWLADLRSRLARFPEVDAAHAAPASGPVFHRAPHLAFFLHDEIVVHTPLAHADAVADAVREAAAFAGRLLFGAFPIDFPLDLRVGTTADKG